MPSLKSTDESIGTLATEASALMGETSASSRRERLPHLRTGKNPDKREQIMQGATRVFSTMGFDAASVKDIARAAGVSKGTIYVYFRSKEELFLELSIALREKIFADVYTALTNRYEPREVLTAFGEALSLKLTSDVVVQVQRVIIGVAQRMPSLSQSFYDKASSPGLSLLTSYLDKQVTEGVLIIEDTQLAAYQFTDLIGSGLFKLRLFDALNEQESQDKIGRTVRSAVDFFLKAYGK